jgi:diketogulonate reductase-like aldo/keto reductase
MPTDKLAINAFEIPKIGLGTYQLTGKSAIQMIEDAIRLGYRHIDTARMYGNETEVGKAVKACDVPRQHIFITTKIWPSEFERLLRATEDSLWQLKTDYIDLLLLHWPQDEDANKRALEQLHQAMLKGYAKYIGVSNFTLNQLEQAMPVAPVICNQVEYHPYLSQEKMLAFLKQHDMFLTAYSPLAIGKVMKDKTLTLLAEKYAKSISQVTLRWLVQQGVVAIPKASSKERMQQNLGIFDFELSGEDMNAVFALSSGRRLRNPDFAPRWD